MGTRWRGAVERNQGDIGFRRGCKCRITPEERCKTISTLALPGGEVEYPVVGEVELNLRLFMNQDPTVLKNALSLKNARFIVVDAPQWKEVLIGEQILLKLGYYLLNI